MNFPPDKPSRITELLHNGVLRFQQLPPIPKTFAAVLAILLGLRLFFWLIDVISGLLAFLLVVVAAIAAIWVIWGLLFDNHE